jgi:hypothetical protein
MAAVWVGWSIWAPLPQAASRTVRLRAKAVRTAENFMILGNAEFIDELL